MRNKLMDQITTGLVFLSCILSWVGWGFADHLASELQSGIDEYNRRDEYGDDYLVRKGSAAWAGFAGCVSLAIPIGRCELKHSVRYHLRESFRVNKMEVCAETGSALQRQCLILGHGCLSCGYRVLEHIACCRVP